jgi:hypothetical protein
MRRNQNYAICIKNPAAVDLELRKVYRVLQDNAADGYVRVIDESGEDYPYPAEYFAAKRGLRTVTVPRNR